MQVTEFLKQISNIEIFCLLIMVTRVYGCVNSFLFIVRFCNDNVHIYIYI